MKLLFSLSFLVIFLLFEIILFYPPFIYIFSAFLGACCVFSFLKLKKKITFDYHIFLWLSAGFFYLLVNSFFLVFVKEAFLRHMLVFLTAFLTAFWLIRFRRFIQERIYQEIDAFLFRALSLFSFYFGITSVYGGRIFLSVHPLFSIGFFVVTVLLSTLWFWQGVLVKKDASASELSVSDIQENTQNLQLSEKKDSETIAQGEGFDNLKYFLWALITILSLELAFAVYFLPLPIFSLAVIVFLFWFSLIWILRDYFLGIFDFKKYKIKLVLFLLIIVMILFTIKWQI